MPFPPPPQTKAQGHNSKHLLHQRKNALPISPHSMRPCPRSSRILAAKSAPEHLLARRRLAHAVAAETLVHAEHFGLKADPIVLVVGRSRRVVVVVAVANPCWERRSPSSSSSSVVLVGRRASYFARTVIVVVIVAVACVPWCQRRRAGRSLMACATNRSALRSRARHELMLLLLLLLMLLSMILPSRRRHTRRCHGSSSTSTRIHPARRHIILLQPQPRRIRLETLDRPPQPLTNQALGAQIFNQLERHVELGAALLAKGDGRVRGRDKQDGDGGREEVVVKDLDPLVHRACLVEPRQELDRFLGEVDDALGEVFVLRDARCAVEDGRVQPDANLRARCVS